MSSKKNHGKARSDRPDREKSAPARPTKIDPADQVVILQYAEGRPSNLSKFKRWIGPKWIEQFGDLGTLIDTNVVPVVPALPVPGAGAFDDANDPLGIIRAQYMADMKSRQARVDDIQKNTKPMFAYIWMHLSDESKEVLSTQANWNAIQAAYNIAAMWGLVVQVHQGGGNAQALINEGDMSRYSTTSADSPIQSQASNK